MGVEWDLLAPFVAGVEYFSGREPGWGYLFSAGIGRPEDISGFTTTASPALNVSKNADHNDSVQRTKFLPEALWMYVVEGRLCCSSGCHYSSSREPGTGEEVNDISNDLYIQPQPQAGPHYETFLGSYTFSLGSVEQNVPDEAFSRRLTRVISLE